MEGKFGLKRWGLKSGQTHLYRYRKMAALRIVLAYRTVSAPDSWHNPCGSAGGRADGDLFTKSVGGPINGHFRQRRWIDENRGR